jgi:SNF2 family DNA or RNA helicase
MSLRLVCNHHYLFLYKKKFQIPPNDKFRVDFIDSSNKLRFLERVMPKLLKKDHKMLIFSQFTMMLDILGEFCKYKGYAYERLDGSTQVYLNYK